MCTLAVTVGCCSMWNETCLIQKRTRFTFRYTSAQFVSLKLNEEFSDATKEKSKKPNWIYDYIIFYECCRCMGMPMYADHTLFKYFINSWDFFLRFRFFVFVCVLFSCNSFVFLSGVPRDYYYRSKDWTPVCLLGYRCGNWAESSLHLK